MGRSEMPWYVFPSELPKSLSDLYPVLSSFFGAPSIVDSLEGVDLADQPIVAVAADVHSASSVVSWLTNLGSGTKNDIVVIVPDGYLGTDGADRTLATYGAAAISCVRSLAGTRGTAVRANAVAIPDEMVGTTGEMGGPLAHRTTTDDVAEVVAFLISPANSYINGQIIYADSGRHIFSSHTS
jgi:Enoyl-(Acyl carrier protein) reductase